MLFFAFIVALAITAVLIPLLEKWAPAVGLTDKPGPRKVHSIPVPRVGGIAMAAGIVAPVLLMTEPSNTLFALLGALVLLLVVGVWDDRCDLGYQAKFLGQFAAALVCIHLGDIRIEYVTLTERHELPGWLSYCLTLAFLVGVTNAVNLADGLDGLAGGMALLCCTAIAMLAAVTDNALVSTIALVTAGAILGFLRFNTHPARIFMGDGGSQVLGFTMGALAILLTQSESSAMSAALPLLLIGMPILDTLAVMLRRLGEGRSPFVADRNHLHHQLLALGFRHGEAVALVYLAQGALFIAAWLLRFESDLLIVAVFALFSLAVLGAVRWAVAGGWRARGESGRALVVRVGHRLRRILPVPRLVAAAHVIRFGALSLYVASVMVASTSIGGDVALLCMGLLLALLVCSGLRQDVARGWTDRIIFYVAAVLLVYLDQTGAGPRLFAGQSWLLLAFAAFAALAATMLGTQRRFEPTALDFLVMFLAVVAPNLPGSFTVPDPLATGAAKAVVLLYVTEMSLSTQESRRAPRALLALCLGAVAVRALLVSQA